MSGISYLLDLVDLLRGGGRLINQELTLARSTTYLELGYHTPSIVLEATLSQKAANLHPWLESAPLKKMTKEVRVFRVICATPAFSFCDWHVSMAPGWLLKPTSISKVQSAHSSAVFVLEVAVLQSVSCSCWFVLSMTVDHF